LVPWPPHGSAVKPWSCDSSANHLIKLAQQAGMCCKACRRRLTFDDGFLFFRQRAHLHRELMSASRRAQPGSRFLARIIRIQDLRNDDPPDNRGSTGRNRGFKVALAVHSANDDSELWSSASTSMKSGPTKHPLATSRSVSGAQSTSYRRSVKRAA